MALLKKNQKGFSIVEILMVIVIIGLIGAVGWLVFNRQKTAESKQADQTNSSQTSKPTATLQPEDVTGKIKSDYAAQFKLLNIDENNKPKQGEMSIRLSKRAPAYKTEGYNFYTDYDGGSALDLMVGPVNGAVDTLPRKADITVRTEVANTFKEFGLVKTETYGDKEDGTEKDVYTGKGLICTIEAPTAPTSSVSAICGRIDDYKETAAKTQPLASAMPNISQSTVLTRLEITDSEVSGYQRAGVSQGSIDGGGGSIALLYRKNNGAWVYFRNVQEALPCSAYNTADLRSAFKGEACYGANDQSTTVQ